MSNSIPDSYIVTEAGDIGMISCILSYHYFEKMMTSEREAGGLIACYERISIWAKEFHDQYKDFDWETLLTPEELPDDFPYKNSMCWDDMVAAYGADKMLEWPEPKPIEVKPAKTKRLKKTKYFLAITFDGNMIKIAKHIGWKKVLKDFQTYSKYIELRVFATLRERNSYIRATMDIHRHSGMAIAYKNLKVLPDSR